MADREFDKAIAQLEKSPEKATLLAMHIIAYAYDIWKSCGREADFCIQDFASDNIKFGSVNRVYWHYTRGWSVSESHCSKDFYAHAVDYLSKNR